MDLLILIIALAFGRIWGGDNPLHKDVFMLKVMGALQSCLPRCHTNQVVADSELIWRALFDKRGVGLWSIILIVFIIWVVLCALGGVSQWLLFPLLVALLIYSFGRGDFFDAAFKYAQSCYVEDWQSAVMHSQKLGVKTDAIFQKDWQTLHKHVFSHICFRGFDQLFIVIFYFLLAGPVFALFYRLLMLQSQKQPCDQATRFVLMVLHWPAARILGFSFALVGNFSGCIAQIIPFMKTLHDPTRLVLSQMALGAFNQSNAFTVPPNVNRKDIESLVQLYKRTLWLWFIFIAVAAIIF